MLNWDAISFVFKVKLCCTCPTICGLHNVINMVLFVLLNTDILNHLASGLPLDNSLQWTEMNPLHTSVKASWDFNTSFSSSTNCMPVITSMTMSQRTGTAKEWLKNDFLEAEGMAEYEWIFCTCSHSRRECCQYDSNGISGNTKANHRHTNWSWSLIGSGTTRHKIATFATIFIFSLLLRVFVIHFNSFFTNILNDQREHWKKVMQSYLQLCILSSTVNVYWARVLCMLLRGA